MYIISEKINKTAEKETISNCKRAARRALSFSLSLSLIPDRPVSFLLRSSFRSESSVNRQFWHKIQFEGGFSAGSDSTIRILLFSP